MKRCLLIIVFLFVSFFLNGQVEIIGRFQIDGNYFFDDKAFNKIGNGVVIRRLRLGIKQKSENLIYKFEVDFAGAEIAIKDVFIRKKTRYGNFKIGNFKEPISLQMLTSSNYLSLPERAMVVNLAPSRSLGMEYSYGNKWITFQSGLFFQKVAKLSYISNTKYLNFLGIDEGYSLTYRLVFHTDILGVSHFGISYSYRLPKSSWSDFRTYEFAVRALSAVNVKKYINTGKIDSVKNIDLFGLEFAKQFGGFRLQGEFVGEQVSRIGRSHMFFYGYYLELSYFLFGGYYTYSESKGVFVKPAIKSFGDVELALRYEFLNTNDFKAGIMGGSVVAISSAMSYYFSSKLRIMAGYSFLNFDKYANGDGEFFVGYDKDGNLTKDPQLLTNNRGERFGFVFFRFSYKL